MVYTAPEVVLLIAAIGACGTQLITAWRISTKMDATLTKTAVIEGHVNSEKAESNQKIVALERENDILRSVINDKDKVAAVLAAGINRATVKEK
jgi:hypothetical protein